MAQEKTKRKLAAIFSADVKGYSRLMADDEEATVRTINAYRALMTGLIVEYQGRVVDAKGDNILAQFQSVVDAVRCAARVQEELAEKNDELPGNRRMEFRIGINLGDVIEEKETIYGDGVNIAARLESLAEGGGICISGTAFDQVVKKLPLGYKYLGEQKVKNIEKPIRTYKVLVEPESVGKVIGEHPRLKTWHWTAIYGLAVLFIVAGVLSLWEFYVRPDVAPASVEKMAYPLPDKPSIAVLPFDNLSKDPEQDYLCDGITEEIITALAKIPNLFVIARNSTFTYKGKPVKVQQVAEDLGVRYVLEGSIRKSGDRVRITAQLIDAITGKHVWAERYDKPFRDLFEIEDDITKKIITALTIKLTEGEQARMWSKKTKNLDVYLKMLEATVLWRKETKESYNRFGQIGQEIIDMAPDSAIGYRLLAWYYWWLVSAGKSPKEYFSKAFKLAQKAVSLDESDPRSYALLSNMYVMLRKYEEAIRAGERSIALDPNGADCHGIFGRTLNFAGRTDEAIPHLNYAIRLNPITPSWYFSVLGECYVVKSQYEKALVEWKNALEVAPGSIGSHIGITVAYSLLGREKEARAATRKVLEIAPKFSISNMSKILPYKNEADLKRIVDAMRKAGLPE
jgi:adenylate cyclase